MYVIEEGVEYRQNTYYYERGNKGWLKNVSNLAVGAVAKSTTSYFLGPTLTVLVLVSNRD